MGTVHIFMCMLTEHLTITIMSMLTAIRMSPRKSNTCTTTCMKMAHRMSIFMSTAIILMTINMLTVTPMKRLFITDLVPPVPMHPV
jgi:hypothetical protein